MTGGGIAGGLNHALNLANKTAVVTGASKGIAALYTPLLAHHQEALSGAFHW
jgi:hypothetical protein